MLGVDSFSSRFEVCKHTKIALARHSAPGRLSGPAEVLYGLINGANGMFKSNGALGEAIAASCIGSTLSPTLRGHKY